MNTEVIKITDPQNNTAPLRRAAGVLKNGGLVVMPTETVYGIAANALDPEAVAKIFTAKGRPQDNPLIVHIAALNDLKPLVANFPENAALLAQRFWPGPLTMVLPKSALVPPAVSAGLQTVAIRMPSHPVARALIALSGVPLAAPSANISGSPSPTTARHCIDDLSGRVDIIIDGGECPVGLESTVVSLAHTPPRLLRPGAVTIAELRDTIGNVDVDTAVAGKMPENEAPASPGMKYRHYAPKARLTLVHGNFGQFADLISQHPDAGALVFDSEGALLDVPCVDYGAENDPAAQAKRLFAALRALDENNLDRVFARAPKTDGIGLAVYNRLLRAAAFDELYL